jgi:hypothetical protein
MCQESMLDKSSTMSAGAAHANCKTQRQRSDEKEESHLDGIVVNIETELNTLVEGVLRLIRRVHINILLQALHVTHNHTGGSTQRAHRRASFVAHNT